MINRSNAKFIACAGIHVSQSKHIILELLFEVADARAL